MPEVVAVSVWPTCAVPEIPGLPVAGVLVVVVPPGQTCAAVRRQTGTLASTGNVASKFAALSDGALVTSHVSGKLKYLMTTSGSVGQRHRLAREFQRIVGMAW